MYIHVNVYVFIHIYIYINMYVCMYVCKCVNIYECIYVQNITFVATMRRVDMNWLRMWALNGNVNGDASFRNALIRNPGLLYVYA